LRIIKDKNILLKVSRKIEDLADWFQRLSLLVRLRISKEKISRKG